MVTNEQVAVLFVNGKRSGRACSMYIEGDICYSYSSICPIATSRNGEFIVNGSKYSDSTNRHCSMIMKALESRMIGYKIVSGVEFRTGLTK